MKIKPWMIIIVVILLISLLLFIVGQTRHLFCCAPSPADIHDGDVVSWDVAVSLLHEGLVKDIFQSHNLEVELTLKDGKHIMAVEPQIDAVFDEIKTCGDPCKGIVMMTE